MINQTSRRLNKANQLAWGSLFSKEKLAASGGIRTHDTLLSRHVHVHYYTYILYMYMEQLIIYMYTLSVLRKKCWTHFLSMCVYHMLSSMSCDHKLSLLSCSSFQQNSEFETFS